MIAFLIGLIIGFIMCIPVGPINVWVVNTLLKHNFRSAFSIALGGSLMDFSYFMVILTGLSLFTFSPKTSLTLKIVGVLFIFAFGLK
jgi:threonine/homoserine/homoserine lactone efflux protein